MHTIRLRAFTLALLCFAGACGDDEITTEGTSEFTTGTTDAATTGDASTTGTQPTTGDAATTDDSGADTTAAATTAEATTDIEPATTTDATTSEGDTTGGVDPEALLACQSYCERFAECGFDDAVERCVGNCASNVSSGSTKCEAAKLDAIACVTGQTCDQLLAADGNADGPCGEQVQLESDACYYDCVRGFGGGDDGCEMTLDCPDVARKMVCEGDTCACFEGDAQTDECAAEGICTQLDEQEVFDKAASCCGF